MAERLIPGSTPLLYVETGVRQAFVPGAFLVNESAADDPLHLMARGKDVLLEGGNASFSLVHVAPGANLELAEGSAAFSASLGMLGAGLELAGGEAHPAIALSAFGAALELQKGTVALSASMLAQGASLQLSGASMQPTYALSATGAALELAPAGVAMCLSLDVAGRIIEALPGLARLFALTSERASAQRTFTVRYGARTFRVPAESHRMVVPKERPAAVIRADNRRSKVTP